MDALLARQSGKRPNLHGLTGRVPNPEYKAKLLAARYARLEKSMDALLAADDEKGFWITSKGQHIFIPVVENKTGVVKMHFEDPAKRNKDGGKKPGLKKPEADISPNRTPVLTKTDMDYMDWNIKTDIWDVKTQEEMDQKISKLRKLEDEKFEASDVVYRGISERTLDVMAKTGGLTLPNKPASVTLSKTVAEDYGSIILTIPKEGLDIGSAMGNPYPNDRNESATHHLNLWEYRIVKNQKLKTRIGIHYYGYGEFDEAEKAFIREKYSNIGDVTFGVKQ